MGSTTRAVLVKIWLDSESLSINLEMLQFPQITDMAAQPLWSGQCPFILMRPFLQKTTTNPLRMVLMGLCPTLLHTVMAKGMQPCQ